MPFGPRDSVMSVSSEPEATAVRGGIRTVPGLARGLDRILCHAESLFVGAALAFTSLLLFVNVILRYVFLSSIHWAEEATLYLMVWIVSSSSSPSCSAR
jgi:hypothetical protein